MNALSGVTPAGLNPSGMLEKINDRFQSADVDKSGTLSREELADVGSAKGLETSKIDKFFNWLDVDGDGSVSQQEHEDRLLAIAERRDNPARPDAYPKLEGRSIDDVSGAREHFNTLKTLFESVDSPPADSDQAHHMQELGRKIEAEGFSEGNLSALVSFLTRMVPPINSKV